MKKLLVRHAGQYLFVYPYTQNMDQEQLEKEYSKIYRLYQYMKEQNLGDFLIEIKYVKGSGLEAAKFSYDEVNKNPILYTVRLNDRHFIQTPKDIAPFVRSK